MKAKLKDLNSYFFKKNAGFIEKKLFFGVNFFRIFMLFVQEKSLSTLIFRNFLDDDLSIFAVPDS